MTYDIRIYNEGRWAESHEGPGGGIDGWEEIEEDFDRAVDDRAVAEILASHSRRIVEEIEREMLGCPVRVEKAVEGEIVEEDANRESVDKGIVVI